MESFSLSTLLAERQKNIASYQKSKNDNLNIEYDQITDRIIHSFSYGGGYGVRVQRGTNLWHHVVFEKPTNVCQSILNVLDSKVPPQNGKNFSHLFGCKVTQEPGRPHPEVSLEITTDKKKVELYSSHEWIEY